MLRMRWPIRFKCFQQLEHFDRDDKADGLVGNGWTQQVTSYGKDHHLSLTVELGVF